MTDTQAAHIAVDLKPFAVEISALKPHPKNPRRGNVDAIVESLQVFGQVRPIVVQRSTGYVVAGNHTMKAAEQLGWDRIARVEVDLSDDEALRYVIADNRTADLGNYDDAALAEALEGLMLKGLLQGTGFSPDEVDDILSELDELPVTEPEFQGDYAETAEATAARYTEPTEAIEMRQFVLMYPTAQAEEFETDVRALIKRWGIAGVRDVVREAVKRAVAAE